MYRVGIDSIEIDRVAKSISNPTFVERVFGDDERRELEAKSFAAESAAACFAAKEAFGKAIGTGLTAFEFKDVQVLHNSLGKPFLQLCGDAKKVSDEQKLDFDISITHTKSVATVIVIAFERR